MENKEEIKREVWALQYIPNEYNARWVTECVFDKYPSFDYFCEVFSKVANYELIEEVVDCLHIVYGSKSYEELTLSNYLTIPSDYRLVTIDMY